jgi:NAD+ kinase
LIEAGCRAPYEAEEFIAYGRGSLPVHTNIHFLGSSKPAAQHALQQLIDCYGQCDIAAANCVVAIGGDGTALRALQAAFLTTGKPVFAMRLPGSVGALGNAFELAKLDERLQAARRISIRPLKAEATLVTGGAVTAFGINEIVVSRQALQAAKLCVKTDGMYGYREVVGDGLLVATPVGSTGYNRSAGGPALPLDFQLVALTGIAVHRPSEWSNLVLSNQLTIEVEVTDPAYRAVRLETNFQEIPKISRVKISSAREYCLTMLLEER